jgi:D-3-phosphoglycerate dehydrogenase
MYRILVSDKLGKAGLDRLGKETDVDVDIKTALSHDELIDIIGDYDALIIRSATRVDADVLEAAVRLRVVGRAGIGIDNVDVRKATSRGVIVMNTPQANAVATAEHTLAMMLAVSRHTAQAHESMRRGEWKRSSFTGQELADKILGIIGLGQIGRLVAQRAKSFQMNIVAHDPYVSEEIGREMGVPLVDLDELLSQSDYITLHTSMSSETENMINEKTIGMMKAGVILINPARGKLIDESALADALNSGSIKAAAVDVYRKEPPDEKNPLIGLSNVLHLPHLGASTEEAQRDVAVQIVEQVIDALRNKDFRNSVNMPFIPGADFEKTMPYMNLAEKIGQLHFRMAAAPIRSVEIELQGDSIKALLKPIATAVLKGILQGFLKESVNYVNAPMLAEQHGISVAQSKGIGTPNYAHLISCRVGFEGGERTISGALFGGTHPRIVQVSQYHMDVDPSGIVLVMLNRDLPGVIGRIGTILGKHEVNIGEWRLGRGEKGTEALSFVNLDSYPSDEAIAELKSVEEVVKLEILTL